jgi:hypothetical protein
MSAYNCKPGITYSSSIFKQDWPMTIPLKKKGPKTPNTKTAPYTDPPGWFKA